MDASAAAQPPLATQLQPSHSQVHITADNLRTFCDSLTAFQQCLNDLQRHMNSIQTSINSMLLPPQSLLASSSSPAVATPAPTLAPEPESSWESDPSEDLEEEEEEVNQEEKVVEGEGGEGEGEEVNSPHLELKLPPSELKSPPSELKSPRLELKSPPSELKSPRLELKSPPSELKSLPLELKSPPSELKSLPLELKSPRLELKSLPSELKSPPSELKSPRLELKLPPSELKSPPSELKSPRLELKLPRSELKSPRSELEIFCETMDHCGLRKYMTTHISNFRRLREEVHKALRHSPNPATLVFNCIGKFYITVGKKFANESPLVRGRKAKVLILECLLLMTGIYDKEIKLENWVKEEAKHTALAWLERMNSEGGKPQEIDARGLLFFIGGFGIPDQFTNANIRNLLQVSNLKWSCDALKRSNALLAKLPEIIEEMVANKAVVKAVHIVYSVGMQDKFSPRTLLTTFIRECKKSFDDMNGSQSAHQGNIVAKGKYLGDLRSIIKCLRIHEVDPSKVLPGWEIGKRIASLEKEISEFKKQILPDKKIAHGSHKRKKDGNVWLRNKEVKHSHPSNPWPPQHHRVASNVINNNTLFEGGVTADHNYDYFMPPLVLHGPVEGSMHENVGYSLAEPVRGVAIGGPGAGISANSIHAGMDVVPQGVPYAGQGGNRVDSIPGQIGSHAGQFYGSAYRPSTPKTKTGDTYRPAPFMESSKGLPNTIPGDSSRTPPYLKVSPGLPNTISSNACRPSPFTESSKGLRKTISGDANRPSPKLEGSMELPNTINGDAYRPPPYLEGSIGLPNTPPPHQFVNTVPATELNQSRGSKAVDAHPSSSLYKQR